MAELFVSVISTLTPDGKLVMSSTLASVCKSSEKFILNENWKTSAGPGEKLLVGSLNGTSILVNPFLNIIDCRVFDGANNLLYTYDGDILELA